MSYAEPVAASQLLTLDEAARLAGLSHSHLRHLANQGQIWALKKGRAWLTTETALRAYLAGRRRPGPRPR